MASAMIELLNHVLAPFPEQQRTAMISWVEHEMATRPLLDWVTDTKGRTWTLGQKSPSNDSATVFAMLFHESMRAVVVYGVNITPVQGSTNGEAAFEYFREVVFNPEHLHGPISGEALYLDLREFVAVDLDDPDDSEPRATNGTNAGAHA
jgi:hypothetical protein